MDNNSVALALKASRAFGKPGFSNFFTTASIAAALEGSVFTALISSVNRALSSL